MQRGIARGVKGGKARVIPGRSRRSQRRGRGSSASDAVAQRRSMANHKEPLRGFIVTLDPLPLRALRSGRG